MKTIHQIFLAFLFLCSSIAHAADGATVTGTTPPTTENTETSDNEVSGRKKLPPRTVYLREPLLEGENTIDVSPETSKGSIGIMAQYVTMIYKYMLALGSIIAVLVIMFGGIQIMTSAGDNGAMSSAKEMIMRTLTGLALLFLTGLFLYAINPNFYTFGGESTATSNQGAAGR